LVAAWLLLELWLAEDDELELALAGWLLALLLIDDGLFVEAVELLEAAGWLLEVAGMLPVAEFADAAGWLLEVAEFADAAGWLDEDGWLLLVELEEATDAPPEMPSAARVCWSSWPEAERPWACWKLCSAACVFGPILPSIAPGSWPLSFSACWTCFTWLSPDEAEADAAGAAFGASIAALCCAELAVELVEAEVDGWLAANAAVMERANAVRANFLIMMNSFPLKRRTAAIVSAWPLGLALLERVIAPAKDGVAMRVPQRPAMAHPLGLRARPARAFLEGEGRRSLRTTNQAIPRTLSAAQAAP
jgi:hypothetical protein